MSGSHRRALTAPPTLFDWFNSHLEGARDERGADLSPEATLYLAQLMTARARTDAPQSPETTLAELHARAALAPPAEQARTYRELGDRALHQLGCFRDSFKRRAVGPSYYADMGQAAYARVDDLFRRWFSSAFGPLWRELAEQFDVCVALIEDVQQQRHATDPDDVLALYQKWLDTGSTEALAHLRARGLVLSGRGPAH
jgi:hypothetical protein